jgi:hypothetical protein
LILATLGALADVGLALAPWVPSAGPQRASDVDAGWLGRTLGARVPGARVLEVEDRGATSGTTHRRRLRLAWNAAGRDAGLPIHVFLKATSPSPKNRAMVAGLSMAATEVRFYEQVRPALGAVAPEAYFGWAGRGGRFVLVLEDLVESGASPIGAGEPVTVGHVRAVIEQLARLHAAYWESPRLAGDLAWAKPMAGRPGFALLANQFRRVRRTFLDRAAERGLSAQVRQMARLVNEHDAVLYRTWAEGPQTIVHGDAHVGNTYALPGGGAGLLDWQVVFRTRGVREISYLVAPTLDRATRRAHEQDLIRRYLEVLAQCGVAEPPTFDQAWDDYRFFVHDAWDSVALTILWSGLHPPDVLETAFDRTATAVDDLATDQIVEQRVKEGLGEHRAGQRSRPR